jgi:hypothetical protein
MQTPPMDPQRSDDTGFPVIKRMAPHQPGAVKLARRYGDALVCVRYRQDPDGQHRCTTVELVVERVPIVRRPGRVLGLRLRHDEKTLRIQLLQAGAVWDAAAKLWRVPAAAVKALGLEGRVVEK